MSDYDEMAPGPPCGICGEPKYATVELTGYYPAHYLIEDHDFITIESANRVRAVYSAEIEAVLMHGRDYLALMTPENRALLVEALDNLEAVTR